MPLIHLVLAGSDFQYVNRLSQWFIENKSSQFQIQLLPKESFLNFLQSENEIDVILAEESFLSNTQV